MTKTQAISPDSTCHCATLERASKPHSAAASVRLTSTCDTDLNTCTVFSVPHLAHKYAPSQLSQVLEIFCMYTRGANFQKAACHRPLLCGVIFTVLGVFFIYFLLSFYKHRFPARFCVCFQTKDAAFPAVPISSTVSQKHHILQSGGKQLENVGSSFIRRFNMVILDTTVLHFFLHIYGALIIILKG